MVNNYKTFTYVCEYIIIQKDLLYVHPTSVGRRNVHSSKLTEKVLISTKEDLVSSLNSFFILYISIENG